jgi:hypothetical protein
VEQQQVQQQAQQQQHYQQLHFKKEIKVTQDHKDHKENHLSFLFEFPLVKTIEYALEPPKLSMDQSVCVYNNTYSSFSTSTSLSIMIYNQHQHHYYH